MKPAEPTPDESRRLEAVRRYAVLDTPPERALDDLAALAAQICGVPIALISLVDEHRQWFKAKIGIEALETPRAISFCGHAVQQTQLFVVADALQDDRFADNPLVTGETAIRFYAGAPLVDPESHALGALCVMDHVPRSLTAEQKRALEVLARQVMTHLELHLIARELRLSDRRFRQVSRATNDAVWEWDMVTNGLWWNEGYQTLFGYPPEETEPTLASWTKCVHPDDLDRLMQGIHQRLEAGDENWSDEYRFRHRDGSYRQVLDRAYVIRDEAGRPIRMVGAMQDITARTNADIVARRLAAIVESSDDAIIGKDLKGTVTTWNRGAEKLFGYSAAEMVGSSIMRIIPSDRRQEEEMILGRIRSGESTEHFETIRITQSGRMIDVSVTASPIKNQAGAPIGVSKVVRDITERRRGQEQLLWKTAFFEAQVNSALDAILVVDRNGGKILQNERFVEMWSVPREFAIDPDDRRQREWAMLQLKEPKRFAARVEYLYAHPDEVSRDELELLDGRIFDRYSAPVLGRDGTHYGRIWCFRDITARKRSEVEREASEARYRALFEYAPDGILTLDSKGNFLDANRSVCQMLQYDRDELKGMRVIQILNAAEALNAEPELGKTLAGSPHHQEWQLVRKDGSSFPAEVMATVMPDGCVLSMLRDLTLRKQAEAQLAEQAALLDKARDAILVREIGGRISFWNKGAERLYGWTAAETAGRNVGELLYASQAKFAEINRATLEQGEWHGEVQHLTKNRRELAVEARWTLIRDAAGHPKSILAINTDITERKKLEAQFLRAQRMESIGTLAGGVAHDLNNILAPIMMSIEMLKMTAEDRASREILETIEISARRGADIVRQVLSFARGVESALVKVQSSVILRDLESIIKDTFPKDIRLAFKGGYEGWPILGDPTQLHQVLLNLAVNARDAMPHGGTLSISVENCVLDEQYAAMNLQAKPGRYVRLDVTDTGSGMPADIIEKIFDPFFTTKDMNKGTGLGLSTVLAIVKSHSGVINVYSEPGRGTTFKVYLPAFDENSGVSELAELPAAAPRGNGETILVVDDEASILTITGQTLQAFGYKVLTATDGAQAIAVYAVNRNQIAAVVTDMMMPIMDGAATIRALQRINPEVKIIAASGLNANGGAANAAGPGVKHFLVKPYTAGTLLSAIRLVLSGA